jgi:hypothetical protein
MPAEYLTRRVSVLKEHVGISTKGAETIALEDEALRLFRQPASPRPPGKRGPAPTGGMSFPEIGRQLGRSQCWAQLAVRSALRREEAASRGETEFFDGSILALRSSRPPSSPRARWSARSSKSTRLPISPLRHDDRKAR